MNTNHEMKRTHKLYKPKYMPGLDGFRAVAVLAIIIYHLNSQWLTGGFLGVDTFFVISGYLITSLLVSKYYLNQGINLGQFWLRRFKRLIPALFFLIVITLIYILIFEPSIITETKNDVLAALFYVSNWWYIFQHLDYFDQFKIAPFKHLWSLAIEEQYYVFYPIILYLLLKLNNKKLVMSILFIISLVSMLTMAILFHLHHDISRVYFGTDTRLQTLLLGSLLAFLWPPFSLKKDISKGLKSSIDIIGLVSTVVLLVLFVVVKYESSWLYHGGFYAISLLTLLVIASAVHPSGNFAKAMGNPLFVYIGKRSYSLYLWHFPVIVFTHKHFVAGQIPWYAYIIDITLMLAMTELSYHCIENPIRRKGWKAFSINPIKIKRFGRGLILLVFVASIALLYTGRFDSLASKHHEKKQTSFSSNKKKLHQHQPTTGPKINKDTKKLDLKKIEPLLIGDSVMVDIGQVFQDKVPKAVIDGKVGRQLIEAKPLVQGSYSNYNTPKQDVVLELGTNGDFTKEQLDELIGTLKDANIYLVTTRVPRDYQNHVNSEIHAAEKRYKNVHVVDWYAKSANHTEYFAYDGIHLEYDGSKALAQAIIDKLTEVHKQEKQ